MDEAHGVGQDDRLAVAELRLAAGRVEGREEPVLRDDVLASGERVEQGRLARVRVADDRDTRDVAAVARPSGRLALAPDVSDALLELLDALADDAPVGLELGLARSTGPDAATRSRQVCPETRQARQLVLELGELDLEAALVGAGMLREDVEDQPAAVDDLGPDDRFERALLLGSQLVVGDEQREAGLGLRGRQLGRAALAEVPLGIDVATVLPFRTDDLRAGRVGQARELGERILRRPAVGVAGLDRDEESALDLGLEIDRATTGHVAPA